MSRVLLLLLVVMTNSVATMHAEASDVATKLFGSIPVQTTESGQHWQLHLRIPSRDGVLGRIRASHLPDGAVMLIVNERWVLLDWQPAETQSGRYSLTLSAHFDGEDPATFFQVVDVMVAGHEQPIRMRPVRVTPRRKPYAAQMIADKRVAERAAERAAEQAAERKAREEAVEQTAAMIDSSREYNVAVDNNNAASAPLYRSSPDRPTTTVSTPPVALAIRSPSLERMATQIVSVGRTVSFELRPTVAGGRVAAVHVDRLPRNASFERNPDGSRTFFWPTGHRDQGEHVFRFTANHPDDPSLLSISEAVIIVGDPSLGGSAPRSPAPPIKAAREKEIESGSRNVADGNAEVPQASSDPFSENFDPSLDQDLAPVFDESPEGDDWDVPE